MRWAVLVALVIVAATFAARAVISSGRASVERPRVGAEELSVRDALAGGSTERTVVTGFGFFDPGLGVTRICDGRTRDDPPACVGPTLTLVSFDPARFTYAPADGPAGEALRHTPEEVTVLGSRLGDQLEVVEVLR